MRNHLPELALALLLAAPGVAAGTTLDGVQATAECNGWTTEVQVTYSTNAYMAHLTRTVVLLDESGAELDRSETSGMIQVVPGETVTYPESGAWSFALDGSYRLAVSVAFVDIVPDGGNTYTAETEVPFGCGVEVVLPEPVCLHPRSFWVRHPDAWPVTRLELGGAVLDQDELMGLLHRPPRADVRFLLIRQLITAKLNVANGAENSAAEAIARADAWLADHPVFSRLRGRDRLVAVKLGLTLMWYNLQGCPEDAAKALTMDQDEDLPLLESLEKEFVEPQSFGAVKSMFR
ncbi:hypothetical protein KJ682_05445 [bacterium]|nr:hypothetical protein [bacterium]